MRKSVLAAALAACRLAASPAAALAATPSANASTDTSHAVWTDAPGQQGLANYNERAVAADSESLAAPQAESSAAAQAASGTPPWRACGWRDKEDKIIKEWPTASNPSRKWLLRCGNDSFGYFHIKKGHMDQWQTLAAYTQEGWMDVADTAITAALATPDKVKPAGGNQTCRSRTIFLVDKRTGKTVKQTKIRMFTDNANYNVRTAFPGPECS